MQCHAGAGQGRGTERPDRENTINTLRIQSMSKRFLVLAAIAALMLAPAIAGAVPIVIGGTGTLGTFSGTFDYTATDDTSGTVDIVLNNDSLTAGFLTGFLFNIPDGATVTGRHPDDRATATSRCSARQRLRQLRKRRAQRGFRHRRGELRRQLLRRGHSARSESHRVGRRPSPSRSPARASAVSRAQDLPEHALLPRGAESPRSSWSASAASRTAARTRSRTSGADPRARDARAARSRPRVARRTPARSRDEVVATRPHKTDLTARADGSARAVLH